MLPAEEYEHILVDRASDGRRDGAQPNVVPQDGRGGPCASSSWCQLNGQYEGDATGETFNFEGKTDISIRRKGRNDLHRRVQVLARAKGLTETIDQLLGYASWRDTKTAIFLFNRTKDLSKVLAQISSTVAAHPNFVREIAPYGGETDFRFVLHHRDDPERELTLSVLVFEMPG